MTQHTLTRRAHGCRTHGCRTPLGSMLGAAALVASAALGAACSLVDALGGDAQGGDPVPAVDAGAGPLALTETGIDLSELRALWTFDVPAASDGATFPGFPDPRLVATLETGDADDVIVAGKVGSAVHLDGIDDRLVVSDAPALDLSGPHALTAWIFLDELPDDDYGVVGKERAYTLEIEADTDCIDYSVHLPTGDFDELDPSGCALTAGAWHHVAAVFDGDAMIAYQDGKMVASMPYTGNSVILNDRVLLIGDNTFGPARFLDGRVDEVTVWARALTAGEVETIERLQRPDPAGPAAAGQPRVSDESATTGRAAP